MKLYLAPMEGVVDFSMRQMMSSLGGIDLCVTEFIRVTNQLLPDTVFYRYCPELKTHSKTKYGTTVFIQLLGGDPIALSENAQKAYELGAAGIDLNFGCPAKLVNRHDGGASLLKSPDRIFKIIEKVRAATPQNIPVTAKIRLGFDDPTICIENSLAVEQAGANRITVHCRTKTDMYKPPAYWEWIPKIKEKIKIPVVANGDIWNENDLLTCQKQTGCEDFMIGRGALRDPYIFQKIKKIEQLDSSPEKLLLTFFDLNSLDVSPHYAQAKTKQMIKNFSLGKTQLVPLFDELKVINNPDHFRATLTHSQHLFS